MLVLSHFLNFSNNLVPKLVFLSTLAVAQYELFTIRAGTWIEKSTF